MHNGSAIWDGHPSSSASVEWEVFFSSSQAVKRMARFSIAENDSAADVAKQLWEAWNKANLADWNGAYPATLAGTTVEFLCTKPGADIVEMRYSKDKAPSRRIPANGAEVDFDATLFVYRA